MKILFLDIDGVLNSAAYFKTRKTPRDAKPRDIDPLKVLLLHRILEDTDAKVVVSSSWRLHPDGLENVRKAVAPFEVIGVTPRHARFEHRHAEIKEWLDEHPEVERYAILDDDNVASTGHGENFFKTEWYGEGLTEEIAKAVTDHLHWER